MDRHEGPLRRQDDGRSGLDRWVPIVVSFLTIIAFIFSIGVNYNKLASVSDALSNFITEVRAGYVRRDVQDEQIRRLQAEIEMLRYEVRDLNNSVSEWSQQEPPTRPGPRFERK